MSAFKRGIENQNFISELNNSEHWQHIVEDDDLFIAIRNEYLNVYYFGQSLAKIEFVKSRIKWSTHKKYLGLNEDGYSNTGVYLDKLEELKQNVRKFAGKEKEQVKNIILQDKALCVLDVEVTFGREEGFGKRSIDYAVLEKNDLGKIEVVFYEAKHYENPEIRAIEIPRVFGQMEKYESALSDPNHKIEILSSYKTIFRNIIDLNLKSKDKLAHLVGVSFDNVEINSEPRLIIFEVDPLKINDIHIEKLKHKFGDKRILLKEKAL